MIAKLLLPVGGLLALEGYAFKTYADSALFAASPLSPALPRAYGLVVLSNVVATTFALIALSMKVGAARKKYEVPLPQMYATGKSESDVKFNCVQRGHQQALETYTSFMALSLLGGIRHPFATSLFGVLYVVSRLKWAAGYRESPEQRYTLSFWGKHVWTALIGVLFTSISTAALMLGAF